MGIDFGATVNNLTKQQQQQQQQQIIVVWWGIFTMQMGHSSDKDKMSPLEHLITGTSLCCPLLELHRQQSS